jgi:hypothetical protein
MTDKKLLFKHIAQLRETTLQDERLRFPSKVQQKKHFHEANKDHIQLAPPLITL